MPDFNPFSNDEFSSPEVTQNKTQKPAGAGFDMNKIIIIAAALIIFAMGWFLNDLMNIGKPSKSNELAFTSNEVKAQLKNDTIIFLNYFLNMNYSTFKDNRRRAEDFMTPEQLSTYKSVFYETTFTDKIMASGLATDYIYSEAIPGVLENGLPAIKVIGTIKYTSVKKNVSDEMPITIIVGWKKNENGTYKVDNILLGD